MQRNVLGLGLIIALLFAWGVSAQNVVNEKGPNKPVKWEFRMRVLKNTFEINDPSVTELGDQGWQLVTVTTLPKDRGEGILVYFQRRQD